MTNISSSELASSELTAFSEGINSLNSLSGFSFLHIVLDLVLDLVVDLLLDLVSHLDFHITFWNTTSMLTKISEIGLRIASVAVSRTDILDPPVKLHLLAVYF